MASRLLSDISRPHLKIWRLQATDLSGTAIHWRILQRPKPFHAARMRISVDPLLFGLIASNSAMDRVKMIPNGFGIT